MADIEHSSITDPEIHEPKGVAAATGNSVYAANGSGSGTWKRVDSLVLKSLAGDGGSDNLRVITDGTNGFALKTNAAYGSMVIINNTNNFALTAAADSTLNTDTDYVLFTGTGAPWASESLFGITFSTDRLTVPVAGVYRIDFWASVNTFPTTTAKIAVKYRVNGSTFSTRNPVVKSNSVGDQDSISAFGLITLAANDYIQLMFASTASGNMVIEDANTLLTLVRAT